MGKIIGTRYAPPTEEKLEALPDKQAFIRRAVEKELNAIAPQSPEPGLRPETALQTLATLNPKECSFEANGQICTGAIAAVLVDWNLGAVSAVLINTATEQVQIPIAKVTILPD